MKMKKLKFNNKSYLVAFVFVMVLNVCLATFLMRNVLAQTSENKFKDQPPIVVEVAEQKDNPLLSTVINVDNSAESYQKVNISFQNITSKSIRGYVISVSNKNTGKMIISFLPTKSFQPNDIYMQEIVVERENLKLDKNLSLVIDYVKFDDGSFWGENAQGQSEHIAGGIAGARVAAEKLKNLIEKNDEKNIKLLLEKPLLALEVSLPDDFKNKSEKWQNGFRGGYKSIIGFMKSQKDKGGEELLEKLNNIITNSEIERGQNQ